MAGVLGGLVVSLGINAAEFTTGLTKAELEARKFAESLERGITQAASLASAAIAGIGLAAAGALAAVDKFAKEAAQFQDLSEKTGASAASLASFGIAAAVAGTSMESIAAASIKLTKNLTGVDDESKAAGAALTALGIPIASFKSLSPDKQIEEIAKALSKFEEGAGKTAVAVALFGKAGADALPFLKELGEGVGRVTILTEEQIKRADEYSDAQARTKATLQEYARAIAISALPAVTGLTGAVTDAIKAMLGMNETAGDLPSEQIRNFAENAARALAFIVDAGDGVVRVFTSIGIVVAAGVAQTANVLTGNIAEASRIGKKAIAEIQAQLNKPLFSDLLEQRLKLQRALETGPPAPKRPTLDFQGAAPKGGGGADRVSEAERFLESLKRQLETTQELSTVEKALEAIQSGRLKGLTPALQSQILAVAAEVDQYKELKKWLDEDRKSFEEQRKAAQEAQKERDKAADAAINSAQKQLDANEALRDEIAIIVGGDGARKALEKQRVQDAINIKEQALALAQLDPLRKNEADAIEVEIGALKERAELLQGKDVALQLAKDAQQLQEFKNIFADSFASAFTSFIDGSKSAKDAFKDFAKSVEQQITRLAAQNIANAIFGGKSGEGFDFSKIISSLFSAIAGPSPAAPGLAVGTDNWRGGPVWVGESGPELVNLPKGASVTPANESRRAGGLTLVQHINVLPGANRQTANQAAMQAGIAVQRGFNKNG